MAATLTISGKSDGFGAQYYAVMTGVVYCMNRGYEYVHTPFNSMQHGLNPLDMNEFVGFDNHVPDTTTLTFPIISKVHNCKNPEEYFTQDAVKYLRNLYHTVPKPKPCPYDVAIHIRRGDVTEKSTNRWKDNEFYKQMLDNMLPDYTIGIYSDGNESDFVDLCRDGVDFKLNYDVKKTYHELVTAPILVTAKSDFSYTAAILSENKICYVPGWRAPFSAWDLCVDCN
jgi:hypothetical protein